MRFLSLCMVMFVFMAFIALGSASAAGDWDKGENRMRNSTFENDNAGAVPAEWSLEDGTCCDRGAEYKWMVDNTEAHTGKNSLKVIGVKASGTNWHAKVRQLDSSMENGRTFTFAFWAKVDPKEAKNRMVTTSFQMQHDPWTGHHSVDIPLTSNDWQEYFDTFVATADVDADMWIGISIAQSDVDFWIDDARFFEGNPKDEIVEGLPKFAVNPEEKATSTWGKVKGDYR